jgi:hypothetical protein
VRTHSIARLRIQCPIRCLACEPVIHVRSRESCDTLQLTALCCVVENDRLYQMLFIEAEIAEPVFALSWLITWFAHDLQDPVQACRLYDLCAAYLLPYIFIVCIRSLLIANFLPSTYCVAPFLVPGRQILGIGPSLSATVLCSRADRASRPGTAGLAAPSGFCHVPPPTSYSAMRLANGRARTAHGCTTRGDRYSPAKPVRCRRSAKACETCGLGIIPVSVV